MPTRRNFIRDASMLPLLAAGIPMPVNAQLAPPASNGKSTSDARIITLNGRSLDYRMNAGVKEFHLIAEPVEHEFAPGTVAKCWGYNGSTPGPTIEVTEGDRIRIFLTNNLKEHTTMHWHGALLPCGMDGIGGVTQPHIQPGETWVYEWTVRQHGTLMYHPHADEMTQMAFGMMGLFIVHPKQPSTPAVDRDYAFLLHNWAMHPGTYRPDPSVMVDFDLWTFNSKTFPAIDYLYARSGDRVRIRVGNLSMWNHPIHLHGHQFYVTGSDGGRYPEGLWRPEVTEIVGVGQMRDIEFDAVPGDWAFHCHMAHHTMGPMSHELPNMIGVQQRDLVEQIRQVVPGYWTHGEFGMAEHAQHIASGHHRNSGPANTMPMMDGLGPYGPIEMGGMFTVLKVRDDWDGKNDPGWYNHLPGEQAYKLG